MDFTIPDELQALAREVRSFVDERLDPIAQQVEEKVDIRYIQELLGHGSIKTTERYTHVTQNGLGQIRSPLDKIELQEVRHDTWAGSIAGKHLFQLPATAIAGRIPN